MGTADSAAVRQGPGHLSALEFEGRSESIVLRNIAPWGSFAEGQAAIYCWNGWEARAGSAGSIFNRPVRGSLRRTGSATIWTC